MASRDSVNLPNDSLGAFCRENHACGEWVRQGAAGRDDLCRQGCV